MQRKHTLSTNASPHRSHAHRRFIPVLVSNPTNPTQPAPPSLPPSASPLQFNDDQLKWGRLDFIKLADLEQVQAFVQAGTDYAERTDATSECVPLPAPGLVGWGVAAVVVRQYTMRALTCRLCPACRATPRHTRLAPTAACASLRLFLPATPANTKLARAHPLPAADCFERVLGETRKGTVRRVLEVPLWAARRTLASIDG